MSSKVAKINVAERKVPVIKPNAVTIQSAGQSYKTAVVNLPEDLTFQDLNDSPEVWKLVQADMNKALVPDDKIEMHAAGWTAWASVNSANSTQVILYDIRKATRPKRDVALFRDATYDVRWGTEGYGYFRTADDVRMTNASYPTADAAKAALMREQYPATIS